MLNSDLEQKTSPPKIIPSLMEGFNTIAGHIYLVLFPVVIDLFLWFGPMVRVKNLILPALLRASEISAGAYGQEAEAILQNSKQLWTLMLESFNLLFSIRTYPVGVPSLLANQYIQGNPIGTPIRFEMASVNIALFALMLLSLLGIFIGSFYYALIARGADHRISALDSSALLRLTTQSLILTLLLIALLTALGLPAMCLISSIMLFLPSLGTLPFLIFGLLLVWIMLPLAFTPHGIFLGEMKAFRAVITSVRFVRGTMATTGIFFILVILIGYGLDILWTSPGTENWMLLVGIFGHAFISSGLLAGSFVFYRDGLSWLSGKVHKNETQTGQDGI